MADQTDDVTAERYKQLNTTFYTARPADYFRTRLLTLMLLASKREQVTALLQEGVEHAGVMMTLVDGAEFDTADVARHVATDSQVLLHHAAEALVRLFLAHVEVPPCPWFELASETNFASFKKRVGTEILGLEAKTPTSDIARVFFGRSNPEPGHDPEEWGRATRNIVEFLAVLAERWMKDAHLYNAMKHGLATVPGNVAIQILDDKNQALLAVGGTSVELLEHTAWAADSRNWQVTTRWLDIQESLSLIHVACLMIESLWTVANARYLGGNSTYSIFFPSDFQPRDLPGSRSAMRRMSWTLLEEQRQI